MTGNPLSSRAEHEADATDRQGGEPSWTVHRAGEQSLTRLADQHAAGFAGYATPVHLDPAALADRIRSEHIDLWSSFTLRHDGADVVLVLVARRGSTSRIASMGVPVPARRHGWGRRALRVAVDEAVGRGDTLQLEVLTDNRGAVDLYTSEGFRVHRTLVGFEGALSPGRARGTACRIPLRAAATAVAVHAPGLPWQLDAPSLDGLGGAWQAWTNGPSTAVVRRRDDTLVLMSLLTHPDQRRQGHASALLRELVAGSGARDVRMISIVPEGLADGFAHRCGLVTSPLRQYEMTYLG